ncbi:DCD domain-containing protein NRP-B isoform X1 [Cucumis melo]|uniref:DCD domain-containing protein NRP-B isoform X1 n=1 Tax=Cucumis melo TaxID=3656 RepID=A0ABM3KZ59_CUCME|nr:DCD domain-containing protein NRP-B isoform X1 [Cucumis melo]
MENNPQSFRQFSDQLRVQTGNLANLSLNDSIWSNSYVSKKPEERRNFDVRNGGEVNSLNNFKPKVSDSDVNRFNDGWNSFKPSVASDLNNWSNTSNSMNMSSTGYEKNALNVFDNGWNSFKSKGSDFNAFNDGWKLNSANMGVDPVIGGAQKGINGGFNKGVYSKIGNFNSNSFVNLKNYKNSGKVEEEKGGKTGKKNSNKNNSGENNNDNKEANKNGLDKRFKTLPPSESLPRNETIGGYIFVCNNDTMQENLKRQLFGLPPRYRDSVRAITPGLPIFLYNYSTHQLHGIFEAASFGGTNIDPTAWEDKKTPGESRFPAQVRIVTRKICDPLEEDSFRPILHHYDGPKFRLELNIPEVIYKSNNLIFILFCSI